MNYKEINKEVLYSTDTIINVSSVDMEQLKSMAAVNPRKRIRLCCHQNTENTLHEMLIVHAKGAYVPPHKHIAKSESFHIIKGRLNVVIFDNEGSILEVVPMGEYDSGHKFFYRLPENYFHTVIPLSDWVVFHETTNGPFIRKDMVVAPWAPDDNDPVTAEVYINKIEEKAADFIKQASLKVRR